MNSPVEILVAGYLDGTATTAELSELDALLVSDASVAMRLAELSRIDSLLAQRFSTQDRQFQADRLISSLFSPGTMDPASLRTAVSPSHRCIIPSPGPPFAPSPALLAVSEAERSRVDGAQSPVLGFLGSISRHVPGGEFTVGSLLLLVIVAAFWGLSQAILFPRIGGSDLANFPALLAPDKAPKGYPGAGGEGEFFATITETSEVEWSSLTPEPTRGEGDAIAQNQPLSIQSGLVELKLKQGTTLLIEGPAEWQINGDNSATLTHGKLVAKVPQQAIGFTLQTPTTTIVDLGTEFGVEVSGKHKPAVQVEVIQGKVRMQPGGSASDIAIPHITLSAGESRRISVNSATGSWVVEQPKAKTEFLNKIESKAPPRGSVISREQIVIEDSGLLPTASAAQSHFQPAADDLLQTALDPLGPVRPRADLKGRFDGQLFSHLFNGRLYDPKVASLSRTEDSFSTARERSVEFFFDTAHAPHGYIIQRIESFSASVGTRAGQRYMVFVRFKGRSAFESTAWLSVEVPRGDRNTVERKVSIAGQDSQPLATGVDAIAFLFLDFDGVDPEAVYREIDVMGVPMP